MVIIHNDFKTIQLTLYLTSDHDLTQQAYRFLLPKILASHTDRYPTKKLMNEALEDLYGAFFRTRIERIGNKHVTTITLHIAHPQMMKDETLFDKAVRIFKEAIFDRTMISEIIFEEEKRMLLEMWDTLYDKKRTYANFQFNRLFFGDDLYGIPMTGTHEAAKKMKVEQCWEAYQSLLEKSHLFFVVNGLVDESMVKKLEAIIPKQDDVKYYYISKFREPHEVVIKQEQTDMQQAIIKMGFILPIYRGEQLYEAACLFDDILGGYPESRLFTEVREKQGLCYDVSSSFDPYKGILTITSGVDLSKKDEAIESIKTVVSNLMDGEISSDELRHAKAYYTHQLKSSMDLQEIGSKRQFLKHVFDIKESMEDRLKQIQKVTFEDIDHVRKKLVLDTIYVLHGEPHDY